MALDKRMDRYRERSVFLQGEPIRTMPSLIENDRSFDTVRTWTERENCV